MIRDETGPIICRKKEPKKPLAFQITPYIHADTWSTVVCQNQSGQAHGTFHDRYCRQKDSDFILPHTKVREFIMVMEGTLEISYGKYTYILEEGDSIYYDSIVPHHVHAFEGQAARILAVIYTPV